MPYLSSSHRSDGLSLKDEEEPGEEYVVAGSPSWSSASSQITPSLVSSSDLSPGPTLSSTSSPSHIPLSAAPPAPSVDSRTVSPVAKGPSLATFRDMLLEQREQIKALWDGQAAMLDEIRQRKEVPQDSAEIREHLHTIERRLEMLLDRQREVEEESTTNRRHEDIPGRTMRAEVESVSESSTDLESLHRRWSDLARTVRIHAPAARPSGPSLESLGAPLSPDITGIQQSPPLIPSVYQPSRRTSRSTSTSSVIPGRSTSAPPFPDMGIFSPETLHYPPSQYTGMRPAPAPRAEQHILPSGQMHPSPQDPMLARGPYPMGPPPMGPPVVPPTITIEGAPPVMPVPGAPATGPIVIQLNPPMALPQSAIPSHPPSGTDLRSPHEHGMMKMPASPYHTHRSLHPEHFAQSPPEQPVIAPGSPSTYTHQEPSVVTLPTRTCPIVIHLASPMALPQPVTPSQRPSGADSNSSHEHGMKEMPASAHHTHRSPHSEHFAHPPTEQPVIAPGSPYIHAHQEPSVVTLPMPTYESDSDSYYYSRSRRGYYDDDDDDYYYYYPRRRRPRPPYYVDDYDYPRRRHRHPYSDEDEDEDPRDPRRLRRRPPQTEEADLPRPTQPGEPQVSPGERDTGICPTTREVTRTPAPLEGHDEGAQLPRRLTVVEEEHPRRSAVTEEEPLPPRREGREAAPHEYEMRRPEREAFLDNEGQREAEARQRSNAMFHELEEKVAGAPLVPVPGPRDSGEHSLLGSINTAALHSASRHAADVWGMVRGERELLAKEREANAAERERARAELEAARQRLDETREGRIHQVEEELTRVRAVLEAARQRLDETREARIHELREELNRVREELDNKRQLRLTEADEAHSAAAESHEWLHNQLTEIANLVQQNHACCEENKAASEERWAEKQHRKIERDGQIQELLGIVARIVEEQNAAKREEDARQANEGKPGMEQVLEDLARQNAEQRELFYALSEAWRTDNQRQHEELINAVRATANEQVPYNIQEHLDAFSEALAIDVRTLLGEIGKLREERRAIQHEVGLLMTMRAKYCSGGEFGGNWQAIDDGPPPDAPPQPQDAPRRTADLRTARRIRKQNPVQPPEAESEVPPSKHIQSWATWLLNSTMVPTPPPVEPTLVVPGRQSPELFGPRQAIDAAWRSVRNDRMTSRIREQKPVQPPETEPEMQPSRYAQSWATWFPNPAMAPTPPSVEPTLVVPDHQSPGLFGPRSPRDSFRSNPAMAPTPPPVELPRPPVVSDCQLFGPRSPRDSSC